MRTGAEEGPQNELRIRRRKRWQISNPVPPSAMNSVGLIACMALTSSVFGVPAFIIGLRASFLVRLVRSNLHIRTIVSRNQIFTLTTVPCRNLGRIYLAWMLCGDPIV